MDKKRVAVFIDNSNVFHNLYDFRKSDASWVCLYDPFLLAKRLAGERKLFYTGFYCVRPPSYLIAGSEEDKRRYNITQKYYGLIEKNPSITVKYGDLKGGIGALQEKNVDTQLGTDMVAMAALNQYDVAILVSNDGDYRSAVENTKRFSKKIELLFFRGSASMSLRSVCDITRRARLSFFKKMAGLDGF